MKHVIVCREFPPAPIPPGGIGTYVVNISRLLAEAGETVHVIAQRWSGAPRAVEERHGGRLIVHRVSLEESLGEGGVDEALAFARSEFPAQYFSLQAARLLERLVPSEGIDVIEAQEWEAPLYYFQLRRALGLGPSRRPPCIVHLHSPTEFLFKHNEWDLGRPDYLPMKRMEDYSIAAADAHLCPSRYLARQAEAHYRLPADAIHVIPCPLGEFPVLRRPRHVWERGSICYVGRLEPRKGVIEWVEAAVSLADAHPDAVFEFIGADLPYGSGVSVRGHVTRLVPERLKNRFVFHGSQPHAALPGFLARARAAVVPSRWENCPNTCIEAMSTGLPVIASRNGGMVEMLEDDRTGWIAKDTGAAGLAEALHRALTTTPSRRAAMGQAAAAAIRRLCDAGSIVERHLAFRKRIAARGAIQSSRLPASLASPRTAKPDRPRAPGASEGIVLVVTSSARDAEDLTTGLLAIRDQRRAPMATIIVVPPDVGPAICKVVAGALGDKAIVVSRAVTSRAAARNAAIVEAVDRGLRPLGFAFLEPGDWITEDFVDCCESVLRHCPEVGLVSSWLAPVQQDGRWEVYPCPALPYELLASEMVPATVIRTDALEDAGGFRPEMREDYDHWDVGVAALAAGWVAVTYPAILSARPTHRPARTDATQPAHSRMRRAILERCPDAVAHDAIDLLLLCEARRRPSPTHSTATHRADRLPASEPRRQAWRGLIVAPLAALGHTVAHPRVTARRVIRQARRAVRHARGAIAAARANRR